jgi:hypothetical protein
MAMCGGCARTNAVAIELPLEDGGKAVLVSCNWCDRRSWITDGTAAPSSAVLSRLATRRRSRR